MPVVTLYLASLVSFLILDAIMLNAVMGPLFRQHLGDALLASPRFGPALVFYAFYVAGVTYLVSWPAYAAQAPGMALLHGALVGALAYGTYEFTNLATLKDWQWSMVVTDLTWGTVLTGVTAWIGVAVVRMVHG